jgi:glycosyltransferase involved in cell wall biosynthesis
MSIAPLMLALGARGMIARLIESGGDVDLFDAHYYYPDGAAAALLAAWFRKPFIVTARGTDLNLLPSYAVPRRWIQWTERRAAASVTVSSALRERLMELGGEPSRIRVIRNGVDLGLFRPLDRESCRKVLGLQGSRWLLSVGNLVKLKGHDLAIEALKSLPSEVCLAIVGEGEERRRLEARARDLGVADRVRFVGAVAQTALVRWYNAADVLVLCSSREGLPNVVLEALACGTPVVATGVGGISEVLRSPTSGRLLTERTPAALTAAVLDLFSSNPARPYVRETASRFDWRETTRGQLDLLRTIVRGELCATS